MQCCIAGGGPAGMMLGLLLARAGVKVVVLEKHADFLRDFRGDTLHPSTLEVMAELGLLDELLKRPHQELKTLDGNVGDRLIQIADFTHLPTRCKFLALMPQWDFLNFLAEAAHRYPTFDLRMRNEVESLRWDGERVIGVAVKSPQGEYDVNADLVVAADGRHSLLRDEAGLAHLDLGAPMDVLWLRLTRHPSDPHQTFGYIRNGRMMVMLDRGDYWQCAYVIVKGSFEELQRRGLDEFRRQIVSIIPFLSDRAGEIKTWDDVRLLTVQVNRLVQWYRPGLLCIGDAAHAMSPIGGVGINLAIQDGIAAANILSKKLLNASVAVDDLRAVQKRREAPARWTQNLQVYIQKQVIGRVLSDGHSPLLGRVPALLRFLPFLTRLPAYVVGIGFRPEHVEPVTAATMPQT